MWIINNIATFRVPEENYDSSNWTKRGFSEDTILISHTLIHIRYNLFVFTFLWETLWDILIDTCFACVTTYTFIFKKYITYDICRRAFTSTQLLASIIISYNTIVSQARTNVMSYNLQIGCNLIINYFYSNNTIIDKNYHEISKKRKKTWNLLQIYIFSLLFFHWNIVHA